MNSGMNPSIIAKNQAAFGTNVTFRGGFVETRPAINQIELVFPSDEIMQWFQTHNMQGSGFYRPPNGDTVIACSVGGRIFTIDPLLLDSHNVVEITPLTGRNSQTQPRAWFQQAEQYLIIQDDLSPAIIYDGAVARRANNQAPAFEVPVGSMMAYGLGRLVVVLKGRREYVIGDIVNGGTQVYQFTENQFLNEGGSINVPVSGDITSVKFIAVLDRATGQGDLVIQTGNGVVTAQIGAKRDTWKDIQFQKIVLIEHGAQSQESVVLVNGDMFYRATDGIRTLAMAQRDFQSQWAVTPVSLEMDEVLKNEQTSLLKYSMGVLFDNRLIMSCFPARIPNGCYHRGLVVLDFNLISSMGQKAPPAYDGLWTGLRPTAMVVSEFSGMERCFVFHRNNENKNELWEITTNMTVNDNDNADRIPCVLESRSLNYMKPFDLKKLDAGDMAVDRVAGLVDFAVLFKPDQHPLWVAWHSWSINATQQDCATAIGCKTVKTFKMQYRSRMRLPQPPDSCEEGDNKPMRLGYEHQVRLEWTGRARVKSFRAHAYEQSESAFGCQPSESARTVDGCVPDAFTYNLEGTAATVNVL